MAICFDSNINLIHGGKNKSFISFHSFIIHSFINFSNIHWAAIGKKAVSQLLVMKVWVRSTLSSQHLQQVSGRTIKRFLTCQTICSALILRIAQPRLLPTISKQLVTVGVCHVLETHWRGCIMGKSKKNSWIFPPWSTSNEIMTLVHCTVEL